MLISVCWLLMLLASLVSAAFGKSLSHLSLSLLLGAQKGIELLISISGSLCLWSGFSKLCEKCGLERKISHLLYPLLKRLFPIASEDLNTCGYICENMTANLLGLGNAATPSGIRAVRAMRNPLHPDTATDEMCLLIVLNTASIQLIPATLAALRASLGAAHPFDLLPAVWLCSLLSVSAGIAGAKALSKRWRE